MLNSKAFKWGLQMGVVCSIQNHNHLNAIQITIGKETLYFILHITNPKKPSASKCTKILKF
jgi:hypothetical protein